jgi:hypothetical protein
MDVAMKSNTLVITSTQVPSEPFAPHFVADTLETRLIQAIAVSRASAGEPARQDEAFRRACRRDAVAAIELGRAIGRLQQATPSLTLCRATSDTPAGAMTSEPSSGCR